MSPLDFSHKLANMWGAKLVYEKKNRYPPRSRERYQRKENPKEDGADVVMVDEDTSDKAATEAGQTPPIVETAVAIVADDTDAASACTTAASSIEPPQMEQQQQQQQAVVSSDNAVTETPTGPEMPPEPPASVVVEEPEQQPPNDKTVEKQVDTTVSTQPMEPRQVRRDSVVEQIERPGDEGAMSESQPVAAIAVAPDIVEEVESPAANTNEKKGSAVAEVELPSGARASSSHKGPTPENGECTIQ